MFYKLNFFIEPIYFAMFSSQNIHNFLIFLTIFSYKIYIMFKFFNEKMILVDNNLKNNKFCNILLIEHI